MRQNWEITFHIFFFLPRRNLRENVHHENTVPSFHDTYISIFHYLPTLLTATPLLPPPRPAQSFMAQMPPLIITQSLPLCTQLPFSLCSLALADTRGPSERISAVLLAEFRHGYINKMPAPPASANHYPDTLCTDYSYRQ